MDIQVISHYRLLRKLGAGGRGEVYEAEDLRLGRHAALKFLPETVANSPHALEKFDREARAEVSRFLRLSKPSFISDISPDHSQLLIGSYEGTFTDMAIWALPLPSGSPRRLGDIMASWVGWSSDGSQIIYAQGSSLYSAKLDGTPFYPRFSPDGTRIRFATKSRDRVAASLWEVRADGSHLPPALVSVASAGGVLWRVDSRWPQLHFRGRHDLRLQSFLFARAAGASSQVFLCAGATYRGPTLVFYGCPLHRWQKAF